MIRSRHVQHTHAQNVGHDLPPRVADGSTAGEQHVAGPGAQFYQHMIRIAARKRNPFHDSTHYLGSPVGRPETE
jgi:hypothetical protein